MPCPSRVLVEDHWNLDYPSCVPSQADGSSVSLSCSAIAGLFALQASPRPSLGYPGADLRLRPIPTSTFLFSASPMAVQHNVTLTGSNGETYVEYGRYAARLMVGFGRWSGSSHARWPARSTGSVAGGLSTMYDIHACQPGSIWSLHCIARVSANDSCRWSLNYDFEEGMRLGVRIEFLVLVVDPSRAH